MASPRRAGRGLRRAVVRGRGLAPTEPRVRCVPVPRCSGVRPSAYGVSMQRSATTASRHRAARPRAGHLGPLQQASGGPARLGSCWTGIGTGTHATRCTTRRHEEQVGRPICCGGQQAGAAGNPCGHGEHRTSDQGIRAARQAARPSCLPSPILLHPDDMHRHHKGVGKVSPAFKGVPEFGLARLVPFLGLSPGPLDISRGFATLPPALASGCRRDKEGQQGESDPILGAARPFSACGKTKGRAGLAQWQSSCFVNSSSQAAATRPRTMQDPHRAGVYCCPTRAADPA